MPLPLPLRMVHSNHVGVSSPLFSTHDLHIQTYTPLVHTRFPYLRTSPSLLEATAALIYIYSPNLSEYINVCILIYCNSSEFPQLLHIPTSISALVGQPLRGWAVCPVQLDSLPALPWATLGKPAGSAPHDYAAKARHEYAAKAQGSDAQAPAPLESGMTRHPVGQSSRSGRNSSSDGSSNSSSGGGSSGSNSGSDAGNSSSNSNSNSSGSDGGSGSSNSRSNNGSDGGSSSGGSGAGVHEQVPWGHLAGATSREERGSATAAEVVAGARRLWSGGKEGLWDGPQGGDDELPQVPQVGPEPGGMSGVGAAEAAPPLGVVSPGWGGPLFLHGTFSAPAGQLPDTYLRLTRAGAGAGFGKGVAFVNGFNLGW